jgi:hypothetical protein
MNINDLILKQDTQLKTLYICGYCGQSAIYGMCKVEYSNIIRLSYDVKYPLCDNCTIICINDPLMGQQLSHGITNPWDKCYQCKEKRVNTPDIIEINYKCHQCGEKWFYCQCMCVSCDQPHSICECLCYMCDDNIFKCNCKCDICNWPLTGCYCVCNKCNNSLVKCKCKCVECDKLNTKCLCICILCKRTKLICNKKLCPMSR